MKDKIEEIVSKKLAYCPEVKESDIYRVHRFRVEELKAELSTLIQKERKEAVRKYTIWLMDNGYCDSDVIDEGGLEEYLSSIGKDGE